MDKYIFNNSNGLWYEPNGDYYISCLTLPILTNRQMKGNKAQFFGM